MAEQPRSHRARKAAESALVRVAHHYDDVPPFVLLGGLVPELLVAGSGQPHVGTTDVDVHIDLEVALDRQAGDRLANALANAEFRPSDEHSWRWSWEDDGVPPVDVKFELLIELDDSEAGAELVIAPGLGAVNLRGTGFAAADHVEEQITARVGDLDRTATVKRAGLGGFLLSKTAAAAQRHLPKDHYDIAFVLLHNSEGGVRGAVEAVGDRFGGWPASLRTPGLELREAFRSPAATGAVAYGESARATIPETDRGQAATDAHLAVTAFLDRLAA